MNRKYEKEKKYGICRLCGETKELTFEHIPPKKSFNRNTGYTISPVDKAIEAMENEGSFKPTKKQGGIGKLSLCKECNEFLGLNYVDAYTDWVKCGLYVLQTKADIYNIIMPDIEPLKIIKQIFSMFISMEEDERCYKKHKELCEFVRNPGSNDLPEKYQIHLYLNKEGSVVYKPPMVTASLITHISILCSEFTFLPWGYVMTIDHNNPISRLVNITAFKNHKLDEKSTFTINGVHLLPNYSPFVLDPRTKEEINDTIEQSKNYKKNRDSK
jgi:hypothetical protein